MSDFIDTHCHLYDEAFKDDFDEVVSRMKQSGIIACIMPGIDSSSFEIMMKVADELKNYAFPCIGLHPTSIDESWRSELDFVKAHINDRHFYAIGETGLDEYWSKDYLPQQIESFAIQIEMAVKLNLPVIIHCREAMQDTLKVISDFKNCNLKGVFHAYSGSYESYKEILKLGDFKFGIGGVVTYKKASIAEILRKMSLSDIIFETDCPYLTPVPYRGKRNESSYIPFIAEKVSELTGISMDELSNTTINNSIQLFGINLEHKE